MAEVGNMGLPPKLLRQGIKDMVRISDARMSGTAYGTVVLHVAPEAAAGGPLAAVRDGDWIELDCDAGRLHLDISDEETRRTAWPTAAEQPQPRARGGYAAPLRRPRAAGRRGLRLRLPGRLPRRRRAAPFALTPDDHDTHDLIDEPAATGHLPGRADDLHRSRASSTSRARSAASTS